MVRKFDYPKSEYGFQKIQDELFSITKSTIEKGETPRFKGLLEIISSEVVINTAIHKIKSNKGGNTKGSDGETIRDNFLEMPYEEVIKRIQEGIKHYKARPIRRKYIPKPGKKEMRPLGIPTSYDKIIQECVRSVIEPILEAQFFKYSFGFRPFRNTSQAVERLTNQIQRTGYQWVVEGDISKLFDNVNHRTLLEKLWSMGIRDRRVLMIIKEMLKAGIMDECSRNELGTPQGGIISPLLANVYLNSFDTWMTREWENKKTSRKYTNDTNKLTALRRGSIKGKNKLKPFYLIRYADDWIILTNSKTNAIKLKERAGKFLKEHLKLELSHEKTLITNVKRKPVKFLGFLIKSHTYGKSTTGYLVRTRPVPDKIKAKVKELRKDLKKLHRIKYNQNNKSFDEQLIGEINLINAKIRGIIQYYSSSNYVYKELKKYDDRLAYSSYKAIKNFGGKWTPARETNNLIRIHSKYKSKIPAYTYKGMKIGITRLMFCNFEIPKQKRQEETPYTPEGRKMYIEGKKKGPPLKRMDDFLSTHLSDLISSGFLEYKGLHLYNYEYFLNRAYAFNRDKGKCRVCGGDILMKFTSTTLIKTFRCHL